MDLRAFAPARYPARNVLSSAATEALSLSLSELCSQASAKQGLP